MSQQWIRKIGLTVIQGDQALDLSALRVRFHTTQLDVSGGYPPGAWIRVYNLGKETERSIQNEYQRVVLQAGYEGGDFGVIFDGTIKQIRRGRLDQTTSFLDIMAADGDLMRYAVVGTTLAAGWNQQAAVGAINSTLVQKGMSADPSQVTGGIIAPRGKVMFGLAAALADDIANTELATWTIQDGKMIFTKLASYQPGEAVVLNANTGLIGVPEATIDGVEGLCLLNPKIKIGRRIQLDNNAINTTAVKEPGYPRFGDRPYFANIATDGIYRAIVIEHTGDTRGQEWYTQFNCLAIDPTVAADQAVAPYGYQGVP